MLFAPLMAAQAAADSELKDLLTRISQRMDALEQQNRELAQEVKTLREELVKSKPTDNAAAAASPAVENGPTLDERVGVVEQRTAEQAQTKVEASQKFPIKLTGMLLFNAFANTGNGAADASYGYLLSGPETAGATVRQTILGFQFQGPSLPGGGHVNADLMADFFGGGSSPQSYWFRIRQAALSFDWKKRSISVGQDKPLISLRDPDSLAEVGSPALAGAGNIWGWMPDVRYEERISLGTHSGITGQASVLQTSENYANLDGYSTTLAKARPGIEGRAAYWHNWDDTRRIELGGSFHSSVTHVGGGSAPSHIGAIDWLFVPSPFLKITGTYLAGQNFGAIGGLPMGVTILPNDQLIPVRSQAGWLQLSMPLTSRLTLNVFGGGQFNQPNQLLAAEIQQNFAYAANLMYRIGPNVITGLETQQMRLSLFQGGSRIINHYDLALAYLF
jgi:hypothetical protein